MQTEFSAMKMMCKVFGHMMLQMIRKCNIAMWDDSAYSIVPGIKDRATQSIRWEFAPFRLNLSDRKQSMLKRLSNVFLCLGTPIIQILTPDSK